MIVTTCKKNENAVNGVAQTGGGGSGGSTAVTRVLMPSTVVDGGDGDLAVFAALVLCILLLRISGFVLSFSFSFSSSPPGSEPKGIVTRSNALLLRPVCPCSLRGGFR